MVIHIGAHVRISERGQITIPKRLREQFGLDCDVEVEITPAEGGLLIRKQANAEHPVDRIAGILDGADDLGIPLEDVDTYIEEIRGR